MYSAKLQEYVQQIGEQANIKPAQVGLLTDTMACFVTIIGRILGARTEPEGDLLSTTARLLLISDGLSEMESNDNLNGIHYLVGLGFEQLTALIARRDTVPSERNPLDNDLWLGLVLSLLHYLAGGHRVQALCVLRHIQRIPSQIADNDVSIIYRTLSEALKRLYSGKELSQRLEVLNDWDQLLFEQRAPVGLIEARLQRLAQIIRIRRDVLLSALGEGSEQEWLSRRGLDEDSAEFWKIYLERLSDRGITTFTDEQIGDQGFDGWLQPTNDLLVILPTGAGKTIVAELRTALTLAQNKNVLWLLPTRALVRQTQKTLQEAFEPADVIVEELPTTEDYIPLFADWTEELRHVSVSTPERIEALLRARPDATRGIGLVVVDEAQILFDRGRGVKAEIVLEKIINSIPECNVVVMSAFWELREALREFLTRLRGSQPLELVSDRRPTRRMYGILTNEQDADLFYPMMLLYPPGPQEDSDVTTNPFKISFERLKFRSQPKALKVAAHVAQKSTAVKLRTAIFVYQVKSTETQAERIAKSSPHQYETLPGKDLSRLEIELGRMSIIEQTGRSGVVPHHAGLTPLEQALAEKWVHDGYVSTVCATQTLAQGVNLPFDFSIVTFTKRYHTGEEVPIQEIRNMLGRAGRAGYVSDGISLVAAPTYTDPLRTLDRSRKFFFKHLQPSTDRLGLAKLALDSVTAGAGGIDWPYEMGGMDLTEAQALLHFLINAQESTAAEPDSLSSQLIRFPSIQDLSSADMHEVVTVLTQLSHNMRQILSDLNDPLLQLALKHTGMPLDILITFSRWIRSDYSVIERASETDQLNWADGVVFDALEKSFNREWYKRLREHSTWSHLSLNSLRELITLWRSGKPILELEKAWQLYQKQDGLGKEKSSLDRSTRIDCGRFRKELSLLAQFWAALAVCYEVERGIDQDVNLKHVLIKVPALIREGVPSVEHLDWLNALGGVDRVLAIGLVKNWTEFEGKPLVGRELREQLRRWRQRRDPLPIWLNQLSMEALKGILGL